MIGSEYKNRMMPPGTMDQLKEKNWEKMGLVDGLEGDLLEIVKRLYDDVDFEMLEDNEGAGGLTWYILPAIRNIVGKITDKSMQKHGLVNSFSIHGVSEKTLVSMIDVKEVTGLLYVYSRAFIPLAETFLPDLDAQAESVSLFCDNYVMKLIGRGKKINEELLEEIRGIR